MRNNPIWKPTKVGNNSKLRLLESSVMLVLSIDSSEGINTVEPRYNEPLHNEVLGITNDILQLGILKYMDQYLDITNEFR